jgi:hypothetical protein
MKAVCSFEIAGTTHPMMQHHISKSRTLKLNKDFQGCENTDNEDKSRLKQRL